VKGNVDLYDAVFAPKKEQDISLRNTALEALPVMLLHRLKGIQESSTLLLNKVDRPRGTIAQRSDHSKVMELHR